MSQSRPAASDRTILFVAWPQFDASECQFWRQLRDHLARRGLTLVLSSTSRPPETLDVEHLPAVPSIDTLWATGSDNAGLAAHLLGLDVADLLGRESQWGAPAILPAIDEYRGRAIEATIGYWLRTLATLNPAVVVLWNGQHVSELILDAAARAGGAPILYVERAPLPQALFADEAGLSAASEVARRATWTDPGAVWQQRADPVIGELAAGRRTWWHQPDSRPVGATTLRAQLGIPNDTRVVLFAGQVDEDAQQFLFAPHFGSNVDAFTWLLDRLRDRGDVFVLGKHHPRSRTAPRIYEQALERSGVAGAWRTDLSIDDALAVADRVAAVNSTVIYEALARARPVLTLGAWLLSRRGAAYEVSDPVGGASVVDSWLGAEHHAEHQRAWRHGLAVLLSTCVYSYPDAGRPAGLLGAADLADRIDRLADRSQQWSMPAAVRRAWIQTQANAPAPWRLPDDARQPHPDLRWQQAHTLRHQMMAAVHAASEGRRILIWGAGEGGRLAASLLEAAGGRCSGFISSVPDRGEVHGRPVHSPDALVAEPRDFVLVATTAAAQVVGDLDRRGFAPGRDYYVVDCDYLAAANTTMASRSARHR